MTEFWYFEDRKWPLFPLFPGISVFFLFPFFRPFQRFKKCSRVIFLVLDGKLTEEHVSRHPNMKISNWPFLDLVTLNDLELKCAYRKLIMIHRSVADTIHAVLHIYLFPFDMAVVRDKARYAKWSNIVTFTWSATSPVTPRSTTLGFPR